MPNGEGGEKKVGTTSSATAAAFAAAGHDFHASHEAGGAGREGGGPREASTRIGDWRNKFSGDYWIKDDLKEITRFPNYHGVNEKKKLKPQLDALGFSNYPSKELRASIVFRHQTYLKLGDTERDKLQMGLPTRTRQEVINEVKSM